VASFDGWLRAAIIHFKYHQEWARKDQLGEVLVSPLSSLPGVDLLVPVPLHQTRQTRRGYNQSALLAHRVGAQLGLPVAETLIRARETAQQVGLGGADRQRNVAGAFEVIGYPDLIGKRLVLVDDVITTGATLAACAEPLLAAGATDIRAVTLAREL
jgi:ComF family protein